MPSDEPLTRSKPKTTAKAKTATSGSTAKPRKPAATKTASPAAPAGDKAGSTGRTRKTKSLDAELRRRLITETAHFIAERRCQGGDELGDWLFAERLVDEISTALR